MHTELKLSTFLSKPSGKTTKSARPGNNSDKIEKANYFIKPSNSGANFKHYFS
jgi:hypothetical protein